MELLIKIYIGFFMLVITICLIGIFVEIGSLLKKIYNYNEEDRDIE